MLRNLITLLMCVFATTLFAQQYVMKQYKIENGLPTDMVKAISQDRDGNLWIATDEGFVKYDGARFESYPKITHGNYTKGFCRTRNGKLLAFGDLDLFELNSDGDSSEFKSLRHVSQAPNDSTLSYPKLLYEDKFGALWVSESQAVVKLAAGKMTRYEFGMADRTPQFLRSFSFFEDGQENLFTVSVAGNVFKYDPGEDKFVRTAYKFPSGIEFAAVLNRRLVIGARNGLYLSERGSNASFEQPRLVSPIPAVSYVACLPNDNYFVATRGTAHFFLDSTFSNKRLAINHIKGINHIYLSGEHDIWLSTNEGMIFMQEAAFQGPAGNSANAGSPESYIESIAEDAEHSLVYYATSAEVHQFDPQTGIDKKIIGGIIDGYFQSLISTERGIWAANSFNVLLIKGEKIVRKFDFSDKRMFVTRVNEDSGGNIWLTIPGRREVLMIDKDMRVNSFGIQLGEDGFINDVRDGGDGIYVASNGEKNYLFYKSYSDTVFRNVSVPLSHGGGEGFNALSVFVNNGTVWLATTLGLIKYEHHVAERVFLGDAYSGVPVKSICPNSHDGFVAATSKELIYYDLLTGDYNVLANPRNLPGVTMNSRSLLVSRNKTVWIGTSHGVYASRRPITEKVKTLQPQFVYASLNGRRTAIPGRNTIPYNTLLSLTVSSVTFPEEERVFEFKLANDPSWRRLEGLSMNIITSNPGDQAVQVRARKTGTYEWSDMTNLNFNVTIPFWMTKWFYVTIFLGLLAIIAVTTVTVRAFHINQKLRLEAKVAERTLQLEEVNKELEGFSYSVSHDLRAPLRSINGFASILEEDHRNEISKDGAVAIEKIRVNAENMNRLIEDLLRFSRILHQGLQYTTVDSAKMVSEIVDAQRDSDPSRTTFKIGPLPTVMADGGLLAQVWSNLISNAVKYSSRATNPEVEIACDETSKEFIFHVRDNGAGFDMKFANKLFGVFQRLHTDKEFSGTGIGLALVKRIVARHGGRIWAEGKVDEGATFYFTLPRQEK